METCYSLNYYKFFWRFVYELVRQSYYYNNTAAIVFGINYGNVLFASELKCPVCVATGYLQQNTKELIYFFLIYTNFFDYKLVVS